MNEQPKILVVDDQLPMRTLLMDLLAAKGYAVVPADGGKEALAKVHSAKPDLVLLDVMMPDLSGYEVCKRMRADAALGILPIIMVTALDPAQERIKGIEAGADDFLTKPINQAELLARVKSLLRVKSLYDTVQDLNAGLERRVQEQLGQLQRLTQLKRFFPPHLAELILAGDADDPLQTHRREVTVAFLDLRGFTAFADTCEPEEVMALLRRYHEEMGALISKYQGTLEQFSGDSMMVVFNDPVMVEDPAARAVRMALEMQQGFSELTAAWRKLGHDIALGIGVAHGYATIGQIGYEGRVGYGVIGRVTNLAARLCAQARPGEILITATVHSQVESLVEAEQIDAVDLKGFARPTPSLRVLRLKAQPTVQTAAGAPLRICTFGRFSLQVNGEPVTFSRKAQKKPLDLLRALLAHGGVRVEIGGLTELLWPDSEGDAAKATFDSNLYRLRKLIGIDDVLPLAEGKLSLDTAKVSTDLWDFERLVEGIEAEAASSQRRAQLTKDLMRLYAGHFLDPESQEPWAIAARDKQRAKFTRAVGLLGASLEQHREWDQAAALYARALELDNLAESIYRRLMICYRQLREPVEALNVYRRCRDMLSIVLNAKPSAETEAVRGTLT
jgi:DNA-binding response OmpR family regulator